MEEVARRGTGGISCMEGGEVHDCGMQARQVCLQVFTVDVTKHDQLLDLAKQSRLILNCVGPYRYSGEDVVKACITAGTDYLDVSGEPGIGHGIQLVL